MELNQTLLDEKNEKIISKLDNTIGIRKNKDVLRNIIKYSQVVGKHKCDAKLENYNIVIRNESEYNLYEELISIVAEIYYKNGITANSDVLYLEKSAIRHRLDDLDIKEGIIVIDFNLSRRENSEIKKIIVNMVERMPTKSFIIIENYYCEGKVNALMNDYFSWSMKIDSISDEDKEKYVKDFMEEKQLVCRDDIISELVQNPYYKIKNEVLNIWVNCKLSNQNNVAKVLKKEEKKSKQTRTRSSNAVDELECLIGLEEVKEQIIKIVNFVKVSKKRNNLPMLHMCFTGNPGTGKTSVARIIGKIFSEEDVLQGKDKFVEIHGRDLVGKFVGWTAGQTKDTIKKAEGGVLFIDEAYSLISDHSGGYEQEAIATLLKEMEDKRDKVCVIMAGYEEKMKELLNMNPGFESRIQFMVDFPDYSSIELYEIFKRLCKEENYKISSNIKKVLLQHFEITKSEENFSNGRYVRSLFEKVKIEQANRIVKEEEDNSVIIKSDVTRVLEKTPHNEDIKRNIIGFCA